MELTLDAIIQNVDKVTTFVNEHLEEMGCSLRAMTQIDIALDELFSNVCHYAYGDAVGSATICLEKSESGKAVLITLKDKGKPFDPLQHEDPDVTLGLAEREIGGLGIFMVKRTMDDIRYEYRDGYNILTLKKTL